MSAIERTELDVPATYISPALVSACLGCAGANQIDLDGQGGVPAKRIKLVSSPAFIMPAEDSEKVDEYFSHIMSMMQQILEMMSQLSNNSALRSKLEADQSEAFQKIQHEVNLNIEKKSAEQIAEVEKQKRYNKVLKVFGWMMQAIFTVGLLLTGNVVGAAICLTVGILAQTGAISKLADACLGPNADPAAKAGVEFGFIVAFSLVTGSVGGLAESLAASAGQLSKVAAGTVAKSFAQNSSLFTVQMTLSENIVIPLALRLAPELAKLFGGDEEKWKEWLPVAMAALLAIISIISMKGCSKSNVGSKIIEWVSEKAKTSPIWSKVEKAMTSIWQPFLILVLQSVVEGANLIPSGLLLRSNLRKSQIEAELGPLTAAQMRMSEMLEMLNQTIKQVNNDQKALMQVFVAGNERLLGIADPIAYAATLLA